MLTRVTLPSAGDQQVHLKVKVNPGLRCTAFQVLGSVVAGASLTEVSEPNRDKLSKSIVYTVRVFDIKISNENLLNVVENGV